MIKKGSLSWAERQKANNKPCLCVLCHVGREAYKILDSDFAPLEAVITALQSYDCSKSPYPFPEEDKAAMIVYVTENSREGILDFEVLSYFWEEREAKP